MREPNVPMGPVPNPPPPFCLSFFPTTPSLSFLSHPEDFVDCDRCGVPITLAVPEFPPFLLEDLYSTEMNTGVFSIRRCRVLWALDPSNPRPPPPKSPVPSVKTLRNQISFPLSSRSTPLFRFFPRPRSLLLSPSLRTLRALRAEFPPVNNSIFAKPTQAVRGFSPLWNAGAQCLPI